MPPYTDAAALSAWPSSSEASRSTWRAREARVVAALGDGGEQAGHTRGTGVPEAPSAGERRADRQRALTPRLAERPHRGVRLRRGRARGRSPRDDGRARSRPRRTRAPGSPTTPAPERSSLVARQAHLVARPPDWHDVRTCRQYLHLRATTVCAFRLQCGGDRDLHVRCPRADGVARRATRRQRARANCANATRGR